MLSKSNTNHCSLAQSFREIQHMLYTCLQKVPNPFNPNFGTVQSKVKMLRYSLGYSSVSHPEPNMRYSTVGLPLHPRGCLLRACEAQWTEFQWAHPFFWLSVCMYRVQRHGSRLHEYTVTIWHKRKRWDACFLHSSLYLTLSFIHSLRSALRAAFVPSLRAIFLFLPSLAVYKEECHAPIGWLVSLSQRCHYWNPTDLMLIYTHRWAPKQC